MKKNGRKEELKKSRRKEEREEKWEEERKKSKKKENQIKNRLYIKTLKKHFIFLWISLSFGSRTNSCCGDWSRHRDASKTSF